MYSIQSLLLHQNPLSEVIFPRGRFIIDHVALAKQGDNGIGSIRQSVHLCVCVSCRPLLFEPFDLDYQSKVFVCNQWALVLPRFADLAPISAIN